MRRGFVSFFWKAAWSRPRLDRSTDIDQLLNRRQVQDRKNARVRPFAQLFKSTFFNHARANGLQNRRPQSAAAVLANPAAPWAPPWAAALNKRRRVKSVGVAVAPAAAFGRLGDPVDAAIAELLRIKAAWDVEDAHTFIALSEGGAQFSFHGAAARGVNQISAVMNVSVCSRRLPRYQLPGRSFDNNTVADVEKVLKRIPSTGIVGLGPTSVLYLVKAVASFELRVPSVEIACAIAFAENFFSYSPVESIEGCRCLVRIGQLWAQHRDPPTASDFFAANVESLAPKLWSSLPRLWRHFVSRGLLLDAIELLHLACIISGGIPRSLLPENPVTRSQSSLKFCFLRYTLDVDMRLTEHVFRCLNQGEAAAYLGILSTFGLESLRDLQAASCGASRGSVAARIKSCAEFLCALKAIGAGHGVELSDLGIPSFSAS
jgi:hypothetical protein